MRALPDNNESDRNPDSGEFVIPHEHPGYVKRTEMYSLFAGLGIACLAFAGLLQWSVSHSVQEIEHDVREIRSLFIRLPFDREGREAGRIERRDQASAAAYVFKKQSQE